MKLLRAWHPSCRCASKSRCVDRFLGDSRSGRHTIECDSTRCHCHLATIALASFQIPHTKEALLGGYSEGSTKTASLLSTQVKILAATEMFALQDLAQGAASQQKLIDAAAAVGRQVEHAEVAERQLKSLPAKLKQIQGETGHGAPPADGTAAADADVAEGEAEEEADEEDEEESDDELGSISSGEESDESEVEEEEMADGEEGIAAQAGAEAHAAGTTNELIMEASSGQARDGPAHLESPGKFRLLPML